MCYQIHIGFMGVTLKGEKLLKAKKRDGPGRAGPSGFQLRIRKTRLKSRFPKNETFQIWN